MEKQFNTPTEIVALNMKANHVKAELPIGRMILLGMLAGMFIAIGGATSNTAIHSIKNVGIARTLAGAIFPVGLMMVVFVGGELFTGNCLMIMNVLDRDIKVRQLIRNLVIVYFSNFLGALIIDLLCFYSGNLNYSNGLLGAYSIKVAIAKVSLRPQAAIASGILCNILVCIAILMATASKEVIGKIFGIFFPIWAFVIGGFEHCVANMFYIPIGILAKSNAGYLKMAKKMYQITDEQINGLNIWSCMQNLIPVTLGNLIGGMFFVGIFVYIAQKKNGKKEA